MTISFVHQSPSRAAVRLVVSMAVLSLLALAGVGGTQIEAQVPEVADTSGPPLTVADIARLATPATATVLALGALGDTIAQGSGFFVRPAGQRGRVLVTNFHVLAGASGALIIRPDGQHLKGDRVLAADQAIDLAMLRVVGSGDLPALSVRATPPAVGDRVVAIGTPLGLGQTVSEGIVSARRALGGQEVVQITAPISPGSSGGAVLDDRGRVFAVSTAHVQGGQQLNFAVPLRAGLDLLAAAGTTSRTIAAVFEKAASDSSAAQEGEEGEAGGAGASCGSSSFATVALGYALGHVKAAKVWATTPVQRRVVAELEVQITALIEAEPVKTARGSAYMVANLEFWDKNAQNAQRRMVDASYKNDPTFAEQAIGEASARSFRYEMEGVAKELDPQQPLRCAAAQWQAVQALALRASAL